MSETSSNSGRRHLEHNVPAFASVPTTRCYATDKNRRGLKCGDLARWRVPGSWWFEDEYFCDVHRPEVAVPIAGDCVMRRVRVTCEVLIAASAMNSPIAQREAVARLEDALEGLGAILQVEAVTSVVGRFRPPDRGQGENGGPSGLA